MLIQHLYVERRSAALIKPFITALRTVTSIEFIVVRLLLEDGTEGIGSAAPTMVITGDSIQSMEAAVQTIISPLLIGKEVNDIRALSQAVQQSCVGNTSAKAAVEIALFDAYAKGMNIPLYQVFGGKTNVLQNDLTISINQTSMMVKDAVDAVQNGFTALKVKAGLNADEDLKRIAAIREAVGEAIEIRVDANQGWTKKEAVRIIHRWQHEGLNIAVVEQPVAAGDLEALKYVTDRVETPIMADESVFSPEQAMELVQRKAVDWLNIKLMKTGGIVRALQIADIAQAGGVPCMIGSMMESSISVMAAAHLAAAHPNIKKIDLDAPLWLEESRVKDFPFNGPAIMLSKQPGIGYHFLKDGKEKGT
ncbi:dipeptide epimerase [Domibacillus indicus]|uniref:dipeptide epimerase n=1 Tax=Domibacillus indicus TaxID=1437523 RepID=UPI00203F2119|nr:dipeptide epimerase [Domibacillus indicus]MCM3791132.1 dipeptide epimerase [Domibacillus indicus]